MRFQLVSDLHLEHLYDDGDAIGSCEEAGFDLLITPSAPVLVMAGDISSYDCPQLPLFLQWVSARFQHVLWVLGNHEYWSTNDVYLRTKPMDEIKQILRDMCPYNVRILDNESVRIGTTLFVGSTLWSHVPQDSVATVSSRINDYKRIYKSPGVRITVDDTNAWHQEGTRFLCQAIKEADCATGDNTNGNTRDITRVAVITHHAPWKHGTSHPKYEGCSINCSYSSDAMGTVLASSEGGSTEIVWCNGHTHYNYQFKPMAPMDNVRLFSNQFGYQGDSEGLAYRFDLVI